MLEKLTFFLILELVQNNILKIDDIKIIKIKHSFRFLKEFFTNIFLKIKIS
jgi:hypothetical protein